MSDSANSPVVVGKISGQHGIQGWVKVFSYTRPIEQILDFDCWLLGDKADASDERNWRKVNIDSHRRQARNLLAKIADIDDRNAASALTGKWIAVHPAQLPALPDGEYYWRDLIGLTVVDQHGETLGVVDHLIETGANDVLAVRAGDEANAADEKLLPWTPDAIVAVEIENRRLKVNWSADD